ncbi:MAG TPA: M56 family metallopeptidase [Gemmataceae bacterium]|nr:M56 family metallopeptidase [Gemmataceae bacterium]
MNEIGPILLVLAAQVTLPVAGGLLLSRRRDPAAACGPLTLAAAAALLLTPLAFVPRPQRPAHDRLTPLEQASDQTQTAETVAATAGGLPGGIDLLKLLRLPTPEPKVEQTNGFDLWRLVAVGIVGLAAIGLSRMLLGVFATTRAVRAGRPMTDPTLIALAAELRTALGCRQAFALRESGRVGTAATAGWLWPVILVSPAWRLWTVAERRAVLAHEIAHVARSDFPARLISRLAVALHGYHPLVRWLAARLELRQEMAADARAAGPCGGRAIYLKCLAALALRADVRPLGIAPTFLSRPRTLLRRIAMLRVTEDTPMRRRWPALVGIALLAAAAAGLHGSDPKALAGPVIRVRAEAAAERPPLDASFVLPSDNADEVGLYAVRVGALFRTPGMEKFAEMYAQLIKSAMGDGKKVNFEPTDIEQISGRVSLNHDPKKPAPNRALMLSLTSIRMEKEFDWVKQLKEWAEDWKEHTHAGNKYYSGKLTVPMLGFKDKAVWFYLPDAHTAVFESEENIKKLIDAKGKPAAAPWADDWKSIQDGMVAIVLTDVKGTLPPKMPTEKAQSAVEEAAVKSILAIVKKTSRTAVGFDLREGISIKIRLACASAADAADVDEGCQALTKLAQTAIEGDTEDPKDPLAKAGRKFSTCLVRGIEFGKTVDHVVEVRMSAKDGVSDLLNAFGGAAEGK